MHVLHPRRDTSTFLLPGTRWPYSRRDGRRFVLLHLRIAPSAAPGRVQSEPQGGLEEWQQGHQIHRAALADRAGDRAVFLHRNTVQTWLAARRTTIQEAGEIWCAGSGKTRIECLL